MSAIEVKADIARTCLSAFGLKRKLAWIAALNIGAGPAKAPLAEQIISYANGLSTDHRARFAMSPFWRLPDLLRCPMSAVWSRSVGKESRRSQRSTRGSRRSFQFRCGHTISIVQHGPVEILRLKSCNLMIAATILRPSPRPLVFRVLSER